MAEEHAPGAQHDEGLEGHCYDGIQEYDNPIPGWWHAIFYLCVLFSVCYAVFVHMSPLWPTREQRYVTAETRALDAQFAEIRQYPMGEEKVLRIMGQQKWIEMGASVFEGNCVLCHKADGSGDIGVNMTDEYYKNVTDLDGVIEVITNGAADGAMPSHKTILNENEIALVAAYVASLRGTNLPGKEPEGELIPPFPEPITDDVEVPSEG
ncbi:MAG: cytochrome CBB3 [Phycisphaeraceae bacterium]|nr:MAG: cytochrome CBB3 [Phycisphaeraceae bacterium]